MAGDQNTKTPAVGSYPACCSYYHYYHFRKSDSCIPPGDIKSSLVKARKPVAFMVMAPSFLDAVPFSRSIVIGFFLSCFSDPFLCDHNGHHVPDYRALSLRTGKGAVNYNFLYPAFFFDKQHSIADSDYQIDPPSYNLCRLQFFQFWINLSNLIHYENQ